MRIIILLLTSILLGSALNTNAQRAMEVFTNDGEKFFLYLNGEKQNEQAKTRVTVYDLQGEWYKSRIVFEEKGKPEIEKNVMTKPGKKVVYTIKENRRGEGKLRYFSEVIFEKSTAKKQPAPEKTTVTAKPEKSSTTETHTVKTTTSATPEGSNEQVNVSINTQVNEQGGTVSVSSDEKSGTGNVTISATMQGEQQEHTQNAQVTMSSSTTTTTTSSSSSSSTMQPESSRPATSDCAMSASSFERAKKSIQDKTFEDSKMTMAKQITKSHCLTATQIKEIMELLEYESTRVEYAQFAYPKCQNKNEYYIVNDAFEYESSIDELNEFIDAQ